LISFRRYQDFYLLEQKLTEFHGIFYDARLPPRRSTTIAKGLEYLESIKDDFEHFLRVKLSQHQSICDFPYLAFIIKTNSTQQ
jgi:hypothetical protein